MTSHEIAAIRRGIAKARSDYATLYLFYTGEYSMDLYNDFLNLGDLFASPLEGRAWKRTICQEVHRFEKVLVSVSHTR